MVIIFSLRILVILVIIVVAFTFFVLNDAFKLFYAWWIQKEEEEKIHNNNNNKTLQLNLWFYLSNMHKLWLFVGRLFYVHRLHFECEYEMKRKKNMDSRYACTPNCMFNFSSCVYKYSLRLLLWRSTICVFFFLLFLGRSRSMNAMPIKCIDAKMSIIIISCLSDSCFARLCVSVRVHTGPVEWSHAVHE